MTALTVLRRQTAVARQVLVIPRGPPWHLERWARAGDVPGRFSSGLSGRLGFRALTPFGRTRFRSTERGGRGDVAVYRATHPVHDSDFDRYLHYLVCADPVATWRFSFVVYCDAGRER